MYRINQPLDVPMQIPSEVKDVTADVRGPNDEHVLSSFTREVDGDFHLRFTPHKKGTYTVDVRCKGKSVDGSPFRYLCRSCVTFRLISSQSILLILAFMLSIHVGDPSSTLVRMRHAEAERTQYITQRELDITFDIPEDHWDVTALVQGPDDEMIPSSSTRLVKSEDGFYHVTFTPYRPGVYKVSYKFSSTE